MATREYIGARYVPKFYQNSVDGSTQWQANVVYEPLMWVTLTNGHMYISKKQVPATVGTPAENIEYWLDIGSYNGLIQNLQEQIDDMQDGTVSGSLQYQINDIKGDVDSLDNVVVPLYNRSLVASELLLITDSFGQNPSGNVLTGFNDCLNGVNTLAQGGAHFGVFAEMMENYSGDKTAIKSIILIGGTNEHDVSLIASRFANIKTASEDYPNANVYIAFIKSNFSSSSERALVTPLLEEIKKQCFTNGFVFLGNFNHCLYPTFAIVSSDGTHPTPTGGARIGSAIFNKYANNDPTPLMDCVVSATSKGVTFELNCDTDGDLSLKVSGYTTESISGGTYIDIPFDTYYYATSLPTSFSPTPIILDNGGLFILGLRDSRLKYYYAPASSGATTLPSNTSMLPQCSVIKSVGCKKYKVTN